MSEERTAPERPAARHATPGKDRAVKDRAVKDRVGQAIEATPGAVRLASVPLLTAALVAGAGASADAAPRPAHTPATTPVSAGTAAAPVQATYTVRPGDTLIDISARTRIPVGTLVTANRLSSAHLIRIGQTLVLPGLAQPRPAAPQPAAAPKPAAPPSMSYVVRAGDTVQGLAERYKITAAAIVEANRLRSAHLIRLGQTLTLPGVQPPAPKAAPKQAAPKQAAPKQAAKPSTRAYVVRDGDSLIGISEAQKVTLDTVLQLNSLTRTSVIHPGQKLLLPAPPAPKPPNSFLGRTYPDAVVRAAAANRAALAKRDAPGRDEMRAMVAGVARSMGVDPALALGVAYQESGFNARVVSPANAIGTMQVLPGTGRWAGDLVGRDLDLLVPKDNVTAGVAVLAALLARAEEDDAIAGYYQGLASVRSRGMYEDTKAYVASVKAHRDRFAKDLASG